MLVVMKEKLPKLIILREVEKDVRSETDMPLCSSAMYTALMSVVFADMLIVSLCVVADDREETTTTRSVVCSYTQHHMFIHIHTCDALKPI